ncbi:hypothetical protein BDU57DRAFT_514138 [Ampelomyces quisqualis]|uniref:Uncharacterized protein n=1 Tax=Ampelomyces quisqualis TaxID=50730 RepID=A0A6A5QQT9_AMPQU|nr:hypothetical protein BDU57DRAFT_514138 [Ampelomyces quisqualis]
MLTRLLTLRPCFTRRDTVAPKSNNPQTLAWLVSLLASILRITGSVLGVTPIIHRYRKAQVPGRPSSG